MYASYVCGARCEQNTRRQIILALDQLERRTRSSKSSPQRTHSASYFLCICRIEQRLFVFKHKPKRLHFLLLMFSEFPVNLFLKVSIEFMSGAIFLSLRSAMRRRHTIYAFSPLGGSAHQQLVLRKIYSHHSISTYCVRWLWFGLDVVCENNKPGASECARLKSHKKTCSASHVCCAQA